MSTAYHYRICRVILVPLLALLFSVEALAAAPFAGAECSLTFEASLLEEHSGKDGQGTSAEALAQNRNSRMAILFTVMPPEGSYIYGVGEDSEGLPTSASLRVTYSGDHSGEENISLLASPPQPKGDTRFASPLDPLAPPPGPGAPDGPDDPKKGPLIYADPASFVGVIPLKSRTFIAEAAFSGLICSPSNCAPFNQNVTIPFTSEKLGQLAVVSPTAFSFANPSGAVAKDLPVSTETGEKDADFSGITPVYFQPALEVNELGTALLLGALAGLLLNLMPCVLPVISLKFSALMAVSAMEDKRQQARHFRRHCLIFAAGVLSWFIVLALLFGMLGLVWGQLFQSPVVLCILGFILFLLGLSLFGVFSLPIFDLKVASPGNPNWQAFASGLLATLLATPCSGPLLGGVLGWALRQPLPILIICVSSVGMGMALPYFAMALFPRLVHLLPRPGNWTLRLEQLLGFFLMGSVVYIITLLPPEWVSPFLMILMAIAFAAWLWGQIGHLNASPWRRGIARTMAVLTIAVAIFLGKLSVQRDFLWESFDPYVFSRLLGNEPMLVEFTADWCPSCKAMEHTTLNKTRMARLRERYSMRIIRVDLTRENKAGKDLLEALGSSSIPVLALFPKGENAQRPLVLRDIVTPTQLKDALKQTF